MLSVVFFHFIVKIRRDKKEIQVINQQDFVGFSFHQMKLAWSLRV
jgi:hypothetical protein